MSNAVPDATDPSPRSATSPPRPACGASTCSPGATSTTSRPAGPRSTSPRWPSCGPRPGSRSRCARRGPRASPPRPSATATGSSAGPAATWCSPGRRWPRSWAHRPPRRPGRDLERHAVPQPGLEPRPAGHPAPPRPRRDVEHDARRHARPDRGHCSRPRSPRRSTAARRVATLSESSKHELVDELGFRDDRVTVVHPGIDPRFSPGGERSPDPHDRRRRPPRPRQALRRARARRASRRRPVPDLRLVHRGRRLRAAEGRGRHRRARRRRLGDAARPRHRRRAGRPLPPDLDRRLRLGARGLGHDPHRGRGLRHACGRHPHRRPRRRRASTGGQRPPRRRTTPPASATPWRRCSATTRCAPGSATAPSSGPASSRGRTRRPSSCASSRTKSAAPLAPMRNPLARVAQAIGQRRPLLATVAPAPGRASTPVPPGVGRSDAPPVADPLIGARRPGVRRLRPAAAHPARAGSAPTPRPTSTSTRPAAEPGVVDVGPVDRPRHGHPPERRLPVADGPVLLAARPARACPTGPRSASGGARSSSPPAPASRTCCARSAGDGPGVTARRVRLRAHALPAHAGRPAVGHPAAVRARCRG